ncbi:hypothetical protein CLAFUW4_08791 [Fulvia fulva]|uniref:Aminoglycoside phosphotransferase domain-containing protein n=1 Tax=Passalora fulva TaxID=5499 RepID=A0A9Q8UTP9_PASFU|nr:uncharacterized protein CLAFUR5_08898 [Fulvia fulva]KAK4613677.1 hypothetical protein CLAFUR4_08797 [Fulvia fulva]KAK4614400.1 hypothetical protein CLAFUR0_08789 [Fulvia fulva]UJO22149.1 hypothetical protein CLAFUR5_08898 [Fulvia fulva]WPV20072.1 hypothetical protein CLAFUW4_08791 [Fulvia fulva]WPV35452.1 hypothetical protein CLAFUW7_08792 [Fulvia fulva]
MTDTEEAPCLLNPDAPQWNERLLNEMHAALDKNPATDLLSMFTGQYRREHRKSANLSEAGKINMKVLDHLLDDFQDDPEIDLLSAIPSDYSRRLAFAVGPQVAPSEKDDNSGVMDLEPDFREELDHADTSHVVFPLSERVRSLLSICANSADTPTGDESLTTAVIDLVWKSPKLWESTVRGVVVKCSDEIAAKVVAGNSDSHWTEYTTLEYLAEKAPSIPAPKPHGCISMGPYRVIFMSYVPGVTLGKVWLDLSPLQKSSIQQQLDDIFARLGTLRMEPGRMLGGVLEEGAKESLFAGCTVHKGITTTAQYSDMQFSAKHRGSKTYVKLLRSFVDHDQGSLHSSPVFTHGDFRPDNIMVDLGPETNIVSVTGIIDWEDSGFYPDYLECTAATRTLSVRDEHDWSDWFLHLPNSISPSRFPERWLVDRLWQHHRMHV